MGWTTISGWAPPPGRPTRPRACVYPHWFHISDYSLGYVSGWGIHHIDIAQWGNGTELTGPVEIEGSARFPDDDALCDNPLSWDTRMKYANGVELDLHRRRAGIHRRAARHHLRRARTAGSGSTAAPSKPSRNRCSRNHSAPTRSACPSARFHQGNFLECVRTRQKTICNIDVAVRSDTVCQLAWCAFHLQPQAALGPGPGIVHQRPRCQPQADPALARAVASVNADDGLPETRIRPGGRPRLPREADRRH